MPKKQPRNAFYFFMLDFKQEQAKKGIQYQNMAEVAEAAGPAWPSAPPNVRAKFEAMAKAEKAKRNVPECKFTSTGIPLSEIEAAERERQAAEEAERSEIVNFVKQKTINGVIKDEPIYVIDVNCYCKAGSSYYIGEVALLRFTLNTGIHETYHELVHPGGVPIGYAFDMKLACQELGLDMPDEDMRRSDYMQILATMIDFLRQNDRTRRILPPLYTMPDKVAPIVDFIQQLCARSAEDDSQFRVYRLDTLLFQLAASELPRESLALAALKNDPFKYSLGLACQQHEEKDKANECSAARVKRWAYTLMDHCLPLFDITPKPDTHMPPDFHLDAEDQIGENIRLNMQNRRVNPELLRGGALQQALVERLWRERLSILSCKESRAGGAGPVASVAAANYSLSTTNDSDIVVPETSRVEKKRIYVPLRKPDTDYSQLVRAPPQLSEDEFPALSAGRGRGRGLAANFRQMKM